MKLVDVSRAPKTAELLHCGMPCALSVPHLLGRGAVCAGLVCSLIYFQIFLSCLFETCQVIMGPDGARVSQKLSLLCNLLIDQFYFSYLKF